MGYENIGRFISAISKVKWLKAMFDNPYVQNVLSEFIALGLLFLMGLIVYHFTHRRLLLRFFNINSSKRIVVYLSHLRIRPTGALGIDGQVRSFAESALPLY